MGVKIRKVKLLPVYSPDLLRGSQVESEGKNGGEFGIFFFNRARLIGPAHRTPHKPGGYS